MKIINNNRQKGLSFLEVMVSTIILSMALLWISKTHFNGMNDSVISQQRVDMTWKLESLAEQLKLTPYIDDYQSTINGLPDQENYCTNRISCVGKTCTKNEIIQYDIQQVYCSIENVNDVELTAICIDGVTNNAVSTCSNAQDPMIDLSLLWTPKGKMVRSSVFTRIPYSFKYSLFFLNDKEIEINNKLLSGNDFTIAMWIKPYRFFNGEGREFIRINGVDDHHIEWRIMSQGQSYYSAFGERIVTAVPTMAELLRDLEADNKISPQMKIIITQVQTVGASHPLVPNLIDSLQLLASAINDIRYDNLLILLGGGTLSGQDFVPEFSATLDNIFVKNEWVHIAWVKHQTQFLFYKNGLLIHEENGVPNTIPIASGIHLGSVDGKGIRSELDDIMLIDAAATAKDIYWMMQGKKISHSQLKLYLTFEGSNSAEYLADKSDFNVTLKLEGNFTSSRQVIVDR